jgi:hypothetical protein
MLSSKDLDLVPGLHLSVRGRCDDDRGNGHT